MDQKRVKREMVQENMYMCKIGDLKNLPISKPVKNYFTGKFSVPLSSNFCNVIVKPCHSLIIAKETISQGLNPVILNPISEEYVGTNIENSSGMYDDIINLRTNFYKIHEHTNTIVPIKNPEVIYLQAVSVIRNESMIFNPPDMFKVAMITASPLLRIKMYDNNIGLNSYLATRDIIETIFQTATIGGHDVLILNAFGSKQTGFPITELVDLYNIFITQYGYLFKYIYFALPILEPADVPIFKHFTTHIIIPQDAVRPQITNEQISQPEEI